MQNLQSHNKSPGDNRGAVFDLFYLLASAHAACFLVFLRRRCGTRAFGFNGLIALVMILLYAASTGSPEMFGFFWAWLALLLIRRGESVTLARRGVFEHSRYSGWPWIAIRFPFVRKETTAVGLIEPAICLVTGALLMPLSQPLGGFVLTGTFSLIVKAGIEREVTRARVRAMHDAQIEQQQLVERFHGQRNDF